MSWPASLVLVRHAESEGNIRRADERATYGVATHAYPLTPRGRAQARLTGEYLHRAFGHFDVYYSSYYVRAKETMSIMYPEAHVYEDDRLAEGQRGIYHTMTYEQIKAQCPWELERKEREGIYHYRPPGGENWPDMGLRIHSMLGTFARDCEGKNVLVVDHGHWQTMFQKLVHHFSIEEAVRRYQHETVENASVTLYQSKPMNDQSRLTLVFENIVPWLGKI